MEKKFLKRDITEKQISDMWNDLQGIPEEDEGRHEAVQAALGVQQRLTKQLDMQDKAAPVLWEAACIINPDSPQTAAMQLLANAERIIPILKSYQTATA